MSNGNNTNNNNNFSNHLAERLASSFTSALSQDNNDFLEGFDSNSFMSQQYLPAVSHEQSTSSLPSSASPSQDFDSSFMTVGMFKGMMDSYMIRIANANNSMVHRLADALNQHRSQTTTCSCSCTSGNSNSSSPRRTSPAITSRQAEMDQYATLLRERYGTDEQRQELLNEEHKHGERNLVRPHNANNNKDPLMETMHQFYQGKYDAALRRNTGEQVFVPSSDDLESRHAATKKFIQMFASVQIVPANPTIRSWKSLQADVRRCYSLMVEDHVERCLGSGERGVGLPLYSTGNFYAANYFLTDAVRAVLRSDRNRAIILAREPAVAGFAVNRNDHDDALLVRRRRENAVQEVEEVVVADISEVSDDEGDESDQVSSDDDGSSDGEGGDSSPSSSPRRRQPTTTPAERQRARAAEEVARRQRAADEEARRRAAETASSSSRKKTSKKASGGQQKRRRTKD